MMSRIPLLLFTVIGLLAVPHSVQAVAVTPPTAVAKNWVAIAKHIQNPQLYEAHWADKVDIGQADEDDDNDDDDKGDEIKSGQRLVTIPRARRATAYTIRQRRQPCPSHIILAHVFLFLQTDTTSRVPSYLRFGGRHSPRGTGASSNNGALHTGLDGALGRQ